MQKRKSEKIKCKMQKKKKNERSEKLHTSVKRKTKWKFPHICPAVGQTEGIPTCTYCDIWMYVTVSPIR